MSANKINGEIMRIEMNNVSANEKAAWEGMAKGVSANGHQRK